MIQSELLICIKTPIRKDDMKSILLSIKPKIVKEMLSGEKVYEFRRSFPDLNSRNDISKVIFIYESKPTMAIIGSFRVAEYIRMDFDSLMTTIQANDNYKKRIGKYLVGKDICHAMQISDINLFAKPITLEEIRGKIGAFTPGQSYRYLPDNILPTSCESEG